MKPKPMAALAALICSTTLLLAQPGGNGPQPPPPSGPPNGPGINPPNGPGNSQSNGPGDGQSNGPGNGHWNAPHNGPWSGRGIALLPEFRPIGGSGNNLMHPNWDPVPGSAELAIAPLNFAPGSGTNDNLVTGPNPRLISNVISGGTGANGQNGETNDAVASGWLYVFGQFVDHDISLETTPPGAVSISIIVPPNDPVFTAGTRIAMTRDQRSPVTNTIINTVAGYLDLSQLYGDTAAVATALQNSDGTLKTSGSGQYLQVSGGVFIAGDPRVTENPELTVCTTLFMREHNYWVAQLKAANPNWTGTQLYNMAKAITTAEYEHIIYSEYLPMLIGPAIPPYTGYNPDVNAQVTQEFATAAFRVGHSQVSDEESGVDNDGNVVFTEPLATAFQNTAATDEANGVDNLLRNIGVDNAQATDVYVVPTLRNLLFAPLPGGDIDEMDLIAIDIQRERDAGLGTLNRTRRALDLAPYTSFAELTSDPVLEQNLETVYGNVNNVDLFIGGLAEDPASGAKVGPTFQAIIAMQFSALQRGDRFYWENERFDPLTAAMISKTTLTDIIMRNTATTATLQPNMFEEYTFGPQTSARIPNRPGQDR